ncbi:MAG: bifunctional diaminohydroxyphosphoribosylaminopyrimidine deaminase/5-amino-6-(5-phosphoribosylamino)uracil reductase RibD [Desulfobacteraceae bacterium]|nr:MAG: bifunctional diaminohydroxyphosphoribosylaminopyrimidine deaminase/5-amino-6-(5-phosphoribosylamino)uracil reductase RibD [Desulfobacteraceae bacterium]
MNHSSYMKIALSLAENGRGYTSPNPMVGALVVKDGRIVGKGFHRAAGKAHAEVEAIESAGSEAAGATLYVTLEPCNHTGRTPPCTEKILASGIRSVVSAMKDPNPNVKGGGLQYLKQKGIAVSVGVCRAAAEKLNEAYIKYVKTGTPFVILKCAATLDGQVATRSGDAEWVSGPESRAYVHRQRHAADAILVGIGTVRADNPALTTRIEGGGGCDPIRIVLDTHLSIAEDAQVLRVRSDSGSIIVSGPSIPEEKRARMEKKGIRVLQSPLKEGKIDLIPLMNALGAMEITCLLIEGGGKVIASALTSGIVDKVLFFYAPKLSGGNDGVAISVGRGAATMADCIPLKKLRVKRFGSDVLIEGYIKK